MWITQILIISSNTTIIHHYLLLMLMPNHLKRIHGVPSVHYNRQGQVPSACARMWLQDRGRLQQTFVKQVLLDADATAVFPFAYLIVQHLFRGQSCTLPFNQFGVEKPTCITQRAHTVGSTPPFWGLGGSASVAFVYRLINDLRYHILVMMYGVRRHHTRLVLKALCWWRWGSRALLRRHWHWCVLLSSVVYWLWVIRRGRIYLVGVLLRIVQLGHSWAQLRRHRGRCVKLISLLLRLVLSGLWGDGHRWLCRWRQRRRGIYGLSQMP